MAPATTTASTENGHHHNNPGRVLLVSVPRTASNLLLKVLNVPNQPHVLTNEKCGYFFFNAFMAARVDADKVDRPWTDDERTKIRDLFQQCLDELEGYSARARAENKIMFAKEHAFWLVNPATMRAHTERCSTNLSGSRSSTDRDAAHDADEAAKLAFRLDFSHETYGRMQTYSPLNATIFPDEYLHTWQLAFIIRHPALAWPSMYRAMKKLHEVGVIDDDGLNGASASNMSLTWTRRLFDWCLEQKAQEEVTDGHGVGNGKRKGPLVIDAHDVIHNPDVVLRFCEEIGLDKGLVQFEWDNGNMAPAKGKEQESKDAASNGGSNGLTGEQLERERKGAQVMLATLQQSKGVVKDKAPATVDIKAEAEKWKNEFGEEVAGLIEKAVWDAMPDYEYLKERRVRA